MYIRKFHSQGEWVKTPLLSYKCRSKGLETYRMVTTTTLNHLNTPQEYYSDPNCNLIFCPSPAFYCLTWVQLLFPFLLDFLWNLFSSVQRSRHTLRPLPLQSTSRWTGRICGLKQKCQYSNDPIARLFGIQMIVF